jgi:hypothetical protein
MKLTTPLSLSIATALAVTILAAPAKAATVTYTTSTPVPFTLTDWTPTSLLFQQFNTSLGTLQSVTLSFSSDLQTTLTVTNTALSSSSGTAKTELQLTINDGGNHLASSPQFDILSPAYSYSLNSGDSSSSGLLSQSSTSNNTYTTAPVLAEFTGTGNFGITATTFTQTVLSNTGGNTAASQVTQADLTGSVTYTYIPVPEPSSALMALTGLGMVAGFRRFGRRSLR